MLKKDNLICLLVFLVSLLMIFSCDGGGTYVSPDADCADFYVVLCNKDNIESDKIDIVEVTECSINEDGTEWTDKYSVLVNVACSLRCEQISNGRILIDTKSNPVTSYTGLVSLSVSNERPSGNGAPCYYYPEFNAEAYYSGEADLDFYIVINDPELPGYESKYETIKYPCPRVSGAAPSRIELGKPKTE